LYYRISLLSSRTAELSGGTILPACVAGLAGEVPTVFSDLLAPRESARRQLIFFYYYIQSKELNTI
jgi:hypothetical protein